MHLCSISPSLRSCLFVLTLFSLAAAKRQSTLLSWEHPEYDFGTLSRSLPVTHRFMYRNNRKEPVVLRETESPCGCVAAMSTRDTIAPGATGELEIEFKTGSHVGPFAFAVVVHANDKADTLRITGNVIRNIVIDPPEIDLRKVFRDDTVSAAAAITWKRRENPRFSEERSTSNIVRAAFSRLNDSVTVATAYVAPAQLRGKFDDTLWVATGVTDWPAVAVPITGEVIGFLDARPPVLEFGAVLGHAVNRGTVTILSKRKQGYAISATKADPPSMTAHVSTGAGRMHKLAVTLPSGLPRGPFSGNVYVFINDREGPEITIPVRADID